MEYIKSNPYEILIKKYKNGVIKPIVYSYEKIIKMNNEANEIFDILNDEVKKMREFSDTQEALLSLIGKGLTPPTK